MQDEAEYYVSMLYFTEIMEWIMGTKAIRKFENPNPQLRLVLPNIVVSVSHNSKGRLEAPNFAIEPILTAILSTSRSR